MSREEVARALQSVLDPELGINIVDLGLVYGITVAPDSIRVEMTTTAAACPMHGHLMRVASDAIAKAAAPNLPVTIDIVTEPKWGPEMMSAEARRMLGW